MIINNFVALLNQHKVIIPPIQRDYAQGRENEKVHRIRDRFLDNMIDVLTNENDSVSLALDFIYGYVVKEKLDNGQELSVFKPLDGQQRLTTLFLLHWYITAQEQDLHQNMKSLLRKFSYATRPKSRKFCEELVKFSPANDSHDIRAQIENQSWFFGSWFSDPTISSMLVVLDAIEKKLTGKGSDIHKIWKRLTETRPCITFNLLEMEELGLPDDLYIKMNSRGKELTDFEYFKSQFSKIITDDKQREFNNKIDKKWSDLFWNIYKNSEHEAEDLAIEVDAGLLGFFWYATDLLIALKGIDISETYWMSVIRSVYRDIDNVKFLFSCLDLFADLEKTNPDYFINLFYVDENSFSEEKTRLFFNNVEVNLFNKCAKTYGYINRRNTFSIGEQLMLYACILDRSDEIENFPLKIRKIRNLIASSEDQMRKEYLGSLYLDVESILKDKEFIDKTRFSKAQAEEEKNKRAVLIENPGLTKIFFKTEDHHLLRGSLSIFDITPEIDPYADKFLQIFKPECDYFQISRAMLIMGDYSQIYRRLRRLGNNNDSTWRELFIPNIYRKNFDNTKTVLKKYLQKFIDDNETTNDKILLDNERAKKDWRYYYIKYESFHLWEGNQTNGFYFWDDFDNKPYECFMMFRTQFNGRHWNPYLLEIKSRNKHCSLEAYGNNIQFTCKNIIFMISMRHNAFVFTSQENDAASSLALENLKSKNILDTEGLLVVDQNDDKIDTMDRIELCLETITEIEQNINDSRNTQ